MNNNNGIITSSRSSSRVKWEVTNNLEFPVRIVWVDFEGHHHIKFHPETDGFVVHPGETVSPGYTFIGHVYYAFKENATEPKDRFVAAINVMGAKLNLG